MAQQYDQAWWGTWWPWAEANQGLLSVLALVAALLFALWENSRATAAEARANRAIEQAKLRVIRDFADAILKLLDEFLAHSDTAQSELSQKIGEAVSTPAYFANSGYETRSCIEVLQQSCPNDPILLLQMRKLIDALRMQDLDSTYSTGSAALLAIGAIGDKIEMYRNTIAARAEVMCRGLDAAIMRSPRCR